MSAFFQKVAEWEGTGVQMPFVAAENCRKGRDVTGPEQIGATAGFAAPLQNALVKGTELIHVIREVGAAACIVEAGRHGQKQSGFVMRCGERTGKDADRLSPLAVTIGEEDGVLR